MITWRGARSRLILLLVAAVLLFTLTACMGGGFRHESWPGLTVVDDTIYAANLEYVQALNTETGKLYWSFPQEFNKDVGPFYSKPVLAPDFGPYGLLLTAGFKDQTVYALALGASPAERPDLAWTFEQAAGQYVGSGVVAGELFLIGNGDGKVYALNLEDGALVWAFATEDRVWATPVVIEDTVYIASLDHHLYAVDLVSGLEKWRVATEGSISATPVVINNDLWVGDFSGAMYQIDLEMQAIEWVSEGNADWLWATPAFQGTSLYFADVSGYVYALNVETHASLWEEPAFVGDVVHGGLLLAVEGDRLFVSGYEKGEVHVLDTETGDLMNWGVQQANPGRLPGDLAKDAAQLYTMPILIKTRIQALDLETGKILWSHPLQEDE